MTLTEVIQKDGQKHLYVKSAITSGTTQYMHSVILYVEFAIYKDSSCSFIIYTTETLHV